MFFVFLLDSEGWSGQEGPDEVFADLGRNVAVELELDEVSFEQEQCWVLLGAFLQHCKGRQWDSVLEHQSVAKRCAVDVDDLLQLAIAAKKAVIL